MLNRILAILLGVGLAVLAGCTHHIGFHPLDAPAVESKVGKGVSLYLDPQMKSAEYVFRAGGSGIANKWVVPYGTRVQEFATVYLSGAFARFEEVDSPAVGPDSDVLVRVDGVDYRVQNQAAHVTMSVVAKDTSGKQILSKSYSSRGWSGHGAVTWGGGAFAQKGATRSSSDDAFAEVFGKLIQDLRNALH